MGSHVSTHVNTHTPTEYPPLGRFERSFSNEKVTQHCLVEELSMSLPELAADVSVELEPAEASWENEKSGREDEDDVEEMVAG